MFVAVTGARAQDEHTTAADSLVGDVAEKVVELGEVTVEHARVVEKADGKLIIPSVVATQLHHQWLRPAFKTESTENKSR